MDHTHAHGRMELLDRWLEKEQRGTSRDGRRLEGGVHGSGALREGGGGACMVGDYYPSACGWWISPQEEDMQVAWLLYEVSSVCGECIVYC